MDEFLICVIILFFVVYLVPSQQEEKIDNNNYKLSHCDIHEWVSKSNGFEESSEFKGTYTICKICGYNPETHQYDHV